MTRLEEMRAAWDAAQASAESDGAAPEGGHMLRATRFQIGDVVRVTVGVFGGMIGTVVEDEDESARVREANGNETTFYRWALVLAEHDAAQLRVVTENAVPPKAA